MPDQNTPNVLGEAQDFAEAITTANVPMLPDAPALYPGSESNTRTTSPNIYCVSPMSCRGKG